VFGRPKVTESCSGRSSETTCGATPNTMRHLGLRGMHRRSARAVPVERYRIQLRRHTSRSGRRYWDPASQGSATTPVWRRLMARTDEPRREAGARVARLESRQTTRERRPCSGPFVSRYSRREAPGAIGELDHRSMAADGLGPANGKGNVGRASVGRGLQAPRRAESSATLARFSCR
jgi:hypothetical protein